MMRAQPAVVVLALVGLFAIAVLVGYVGGQTFLTPTTSQRPRPVRPTPVVEPTPPSQQPAAGSPLTPPPGSAPGGLPSAPAPLGPPPPRSIVVPGDNVLYRVQVGAFISRDNAEARAATLREEGYDAYVSQVGALWKVQVGAFSSRENADRLAAQLKAAGYEVLITP